MTFFPDRTLYRTFVLVTIFSIAMGLFEAIVVVYLRQLYYPQGFDFPLAAFPASRLSVEWLREACTIVMLAALGLMTGRNASGRFAFFILSFGIWDIVYYLGLKWLLNWPASLFTWDILFLIPVAWTGPVLAPVICSFTMILLAVGIIVFQAKGLEATIKPVEWALLITGAAVIFCTFIHDYSLMIFREGLGTVLHLFQETGNLPQPIAEYRPSHFQWGIFVLGEALILGAIARMIVRFRIKSKI